MMAEIWGSVLLTALSPAPGKVPYTLYALTNFSEADGVLNPSIDHRNNVKNISFLYTGRWRL